VAFFPLFSSSILLEGVERLYGFPVLRLLAGFGASPLEGRDSIRSSRGKRGADAPACIPAGVFVPVGKDAFRGNSLTSVASSRYTFFTESKTSERAATNSIRSPNFSRAASALSASTIKVNHPVVGSGKGESFFSPSKVKCPT
jgi:hypothetical protein